MSEYVAEWTPENNWFPCEEIVRCRDCRHYRPVREGYAKVCVKHGFMSQPEDFCSWGERKRDGIR